MTNNPNSLASQLASITSDEMAARFDRLIEIQGEEGGPRQTEIAQILISERIPAFAQLLAMDYPGWDSEPTRKAIIEGFRFWGTWIATVAIARTQEGDGGLERALAEVDPEALAEVIDNYLNDAPGYGFDDCEMYADKYPLIGALVLGDEHLEKLSQIEVGNYMIRAGYHMSTAATALVRLAEDQLAD